MLKSVWKTLGYFRLGLFLIIVAGCIFTTTIYSQSWGNTNLMTTVGNVLYTIEPDGKLFRTDLSTGVKTNSGSDLQYARFLFTIGTYIYHISASGDLWRINQFGPSTRFGIGTWRETRLLTTDDDYFYTIETNGSLYRTNFKTFVKERIGTNTWLGATHIYAEDGIIYIIGNPQIYAVDSTTGQTSDPTGPVNLFSNARLVTNIKDNALFTIEADGLYRASGSGTTLRKYMIVMGYSAAKFLFSIGNELWLINDDGALYQINPGSDNQGGGNRLRRFPAPGPKPTPTPISTPSTEVNLALGKPATQSSNIGGGYGASEGLASKAVDGNTDGRWGSGSVTHTAVARTANPWWQVDLGADYNVNTIKIWNRTDCCLQELNNYRIWTKSANGGWVEFSPGLKKSTGARLLLVTGSKQARYVRIIIESPSATLMLAEVEVFGTPAGPVATSTPTSPTPTNSPTQSPGDGKAASPEEELLWAEVVRKDTVTAYQTYLKEYKNGKYVNTAQTRIDLSSDPSVKPDATPTNVNAAKTDEDQYWDEVERLEKASPEIYLKALEAYINKYPLNGKYLGKAYLRKELISKSATPAPTPTPTPLPKVSADDELWNKVKDSSRVADFEVYLQVFPNGDHKGDAMLNISRLRPEKKEPEKKPEPEKPIMCTVKDEVNVRVEPKGKILGILRKGRTVVWIEQNGDWDRVGEIKNGIMVSLGWVFGTFLECDGDEP